jgi:hypothetical protein
MRFQKETPYLGKSQEDTLHSVGIFNVDGGLGDSIDDRDGLCQDRVRGSAVTPIVRATTRPSGEVPRWCENSKDCLRSPTNPLGQQLLYATGQRSIFSICRLGLGAGLLVAGSEPDDSNAPKISPSPHCELRI